MRRMLRIKGIWGLILRYSLTTMGWIPFGRASRHITTTAQKALAPKVEIAAPATPIFSPSTNTTLPKILNTFASADISMGNRVCPWALKMDEPESYSAIKG